MELQITTLDGEAKGSVSLSEGVFGLEPRPDILQRMVRYQLAKRQAGTHDVKNRSEIRATTKRVGRQKGGGVARHGARSAPQFRGGGRSFGPTPRSHAFELNKKVRVLALKHALSSKAKAGEIVILEAAISTDGKTAALRKAFGGIGLSNALIIDGIELDKNFAMAARNIPEIDVLPAQGINVYDILRRQKLVLTKAALAALEARLG